MLLSAVWMQSSEISEHFKGQISELFLNFFWVCFSSIFFVFSGLRLFLNFFWLCFSSIFFVFFGASAFSELFLGVFCDDFLGFFRGGSAYPELIWGLGVLRAKGSGRRRLSSHHATCSLEAIVLTPCNMHTHPTAA